MSYKGGYDPTPEETKPKANLVLTDKNGALIFSDVKSFKIREYYKNTYGIHIGSNGKKIWREELTKLGYTISNYEKH